MATTADVINTPRTRSATEFPVSCGVCFGPLVLLPGRLVPVYVHARHAGWAAWPHKGLPISALGAAPQPGAWRTVGLLDEDGAR